MICDEKRIKLLLLILIMITVWVFNTNLFVYQILISTSLRYVMIYSHLKLSPMLMYVP